MSKISRYEFISMTSAGVLAFASSPQGYPVTQKNDNKMYGLIGKITVKADQRDKLIEILLEGTADMPGCLSYIVSKDSEDDNIIWITEVWDSKESHRESLKLPSVQEAIGKGRPLIAEFNDRIEVEPVGRHANG